MDNVIKNIFVTDTLATYSTQYLSMNITNINSTTYYRVSPTMLVYNIALNNIFDLKLGESISMTLFIYIIEKLALIKQSKKNLSNNKIIEIILKCIIKYIKKYDFTGKVINNHIKRYYDFANNTNYDMTINDPLFMEIALIISFMAIDIDHLLELLTMFSLKITSNSIKILSFISLGILCYFSINNNDDLFKIEKWIDRLLDLFIDNKIDKYLPCSISVSDKKLFLFMLIKYISLDKNYISELPHDRIKLLNECFCTNIENTELFIPGMTSDQIFILSYDFAVKSSNWSQIMAFNCLTYHELIHINLFSSWFYFILNKNEKMYTRFNIVENIYGLNDFIHLIDLLYNKSI